MIVINVGVTREDMVDVVAMAMDVAYSSIHPLHY